MKRTVLDGVAQPHRARRRFGQGQVLALALASASIAAIGRAEAACTPAAPANGAIITCTGTVTNQQDSITGYGTINDSGNTYNIATGATVTGDSFGVKFSNDSTLGPATFNNDGRIEGTGAAGITGDAATVSNTSGGVITGNNGITVGTLNLDNAGQVLGPGANGGAISGITINVNSNSGAISGVLFGIRAGTVTVNNGGLIEGTAANGVGIVGRTVNVTANTGTTTGGAAGILISGGGTSTINNTNTISGTDAATGAGIHTTAASATIDASGNSGLGIIKGTKAGIKADHDITVSNGTGTISGNGVNGDGISGNVVNVTANAGTISGTQVGIVGVAAATVVNSGTVSGGVNGVQADGIVTVNNAGNILGVANAAIVSDGSVIVTANTGTISGGSRGINGNTVTVTANAGTIQGGSFGISADAVNVTANSGTIQGGTFGISAALTANVNNAGTIKEDDAGGTAIFAAASTTVNNAGQILALGSGGIAIQSGIANVNNSGTISGDFAGVVGADANTTGTVELVTNTGTISGGSFGVLADRTANVNNSGTISGSTAISAGGNATVANFVGGRILGDAFGIQAVAVGKTATIDNSGTIQAAGANGIGIQAITATVTNHVGGTISGGVQGMAVNNLTVTNAGTIMGTTGFGINGGNVDVTNASGGTISGGVSGITAGFATVTNDVGGAITGGSGAGHAGVTAGRLDLTNFGAISGNIGVQATNATFGGSTIINGGTIASTAGATGIAIQLTAANDTLTLKPTSRIIGLIDMGNGTGDVVNVEAAEPTLLARGVSSLSLSASAVVNAVKAQLVNFEGVFNATVAAVSGAVGSQPTVTAGAQVAALDPTALAQTDRTLMDFTGNVSSLVQGRLNGVSPTGGANLTMMSYAMDDAASARAQMFSKAPAASWSAAPVTVWSSAFGGRRDQDEAANTLRSTSTAFGGAIGIDRRLQPSWLVGVFAGGGAGTLSVDLSSQKVDTDYVFAGGYSRLEWANTFLDVTVQGGSARNKSNRLVQNNVLGTLEHATASSNGWFVSPEVAYGYRLDLGQGYLLTPSARVRYIAGFFDGYSETGSAQTLSIGSRTLQNFEERGELEVARLTSFLGGAHVLKANVHAGVIAQQRVGDASINAVLIGQNLTFATPGKGSTVGAVAGAGFDYHTSLNVAVFGAIEGIAMSDQSRSGTARGGVRVAF
ncbi:autotransporter domain-containing protein [Bradyrhizobium sp. SSUT112]|uniref:autotransporter domain-containing protein n=1 Tax=Bradyrhizobium sp. SSUT112 TaxID=3040604 RepID=UPI00244D195E|nr:autotransporter domain-containing protein [Bradyrhizobium sp. SSUT112]MDH2349246.1 autotransporter domain-containing protein [Bradyrhizobium sp. SSUT112]